MRSTVEKLLREIRLGEDSFLELKEVVFVGDKIRGPARHAVADEMAAFANSRGGVLILGVHDRSREIVGIPKEHLDSVVTHVRESARDLIKPSLSVLLERMEVPDSQEEMRCIVRVEVGRSDFVHQSPGGYLRRSTDEKQQMPPDVLRRLLRDRTNVGAARFDEEVVTAASFSQLDVELIRRFRTVATQDDDITLAVKLGMARRDEYGELHPTVTGLLLAGSKATGGLMPNAFIQAVAYRGRSVSDADGAGGYQIDARDIEGPLDVQVAEACKFVVKNQRVGARKTVGRRDIPQYDLTAVFEAVVNAVAHRDYSIRESAIRLRMFSDRLELHSPGGLPNNLTVETIPVRQASRNIAITSVLVMCPVPTDVSGLKTERATLMDRRGEGVRLILDRSEALSGRRPKYDLFDEGELRLTIYGADPETGHH